MDKFTFRSHNYRATIKGMYFDGKIDFINGLKNPVDPFLPRIVDFCMKNNISIDNCWSITEVTYRPEIGGEIAICDFIATRMALDDYPNNGNDIIIIVSGFRYNNRRECFDISNVREYEMGNGMYMYIHMNPFTEKLMDDHFDEIFSGLKFEKGYCYMEVNIDEE